MKHHVRYLHQQGTLRACFLTWPRLRRTRTLLQLLPCGQVPQRDFGGGDTLDESALDKKNASEQMVETIQQAESMNFSLKYGFSNGTNNEKTRLHLKEIYPNTSRKNSDVYDTNIAGIRSLEA